MRVPQCRLINMTITFHDDAEFHEQIRRTVAAATRGGADLGEVLAIADRIPPGDFDTWYSAWRTAADKAREEGDAAAAAGEVESARRAYLRASEYYRQASFYERGDLSSPRLQEAYRAHRATFRAAVPLLPHRARVVSISHSGVEVRGYLFSPAGHAQSRPTIIAPAGYDSTAEAGYTFVAVSALERGFNCLVFEGPGQGGVLYELGLPLRHDFEAVLGPVVDWAVDQPEVDPSALVLMGRSFAGYLAPRGATVEHRIAALICDPAQYDFGAAVRARAGQTLWRKIQADDATVDPELDKFMATPHQGNAFTWRMTAHGVTTLRAYFRELARFNLVGVADQIACPTLALSGEGDFAGTGQLHVFAQALRAPVSTHEFTHAEGAGGHCEGLGQDRFDQVVYGWITRQLADKLTHTAQPAHGDDANHWALPSATPHRVPSV